ncbi:transporter, putative [Roseibium aggregatum IAM 12614]|uniref:Transporter, putative n=1 Tax=Roseibium aggregatum (strain ATCC 25650 / DSM 13394 / JCM 20685 / NBRC 16684 / NCIMB 2208 / IAM 12614 / B1) TaxID=384765 RepID=A0NRV6_ROSAI|nr:transporter, putative [Roseibium aggregatum IAM 12614]
MLVASRLLAGAGGVILNVVMTKMLVDWFAGKEISTAMAIFINSWPVGIAAALLTLPLIAASGDLTLAWWAVTAVILAGLVLLLMFYRSPMGATTAPSLRIAQLPVYALVLASTIWALYNAALAMVFSFGPALLKDQGWTLAAAGSVISAFMVVFSVAVPLGGILADKTGRANAIIIVSLAAFAVLMPLVPVLPPFAVAVVFLIVGGLFALAAGPIMTLPSSILPPASRTFGMGVFFSIYYVVMMVAPRVAGELADWTGNAGIALIAGAGMAAICILVLFLFGKARRKLTPA